MCIAHSIRKEVKTTIPSLVITFVILGQHNWKILGTVGTIKLFRAFCHSNYFQESWLEVRDLNVDF